MKGIDKLERNSPGIYIKVLKNDNNGKIFNYKCGEGTQDSTIKLFLIEKSEINHYILINTLSSYLNKQNTCKSHSKYYKCHRCINKTIIK